VGTKWVKEMKVEMQGFGGSWGWVPVLGKYIAGYADGDNNLYDVAQAKRECLKNRFCTGISCNATKSRCSISSAVVPDNRSLLPASPTLGLAYVKPNYINTQQTTEATGKSFKTGITGVSVNDKYDVFFDRPVWGT